MLGIIFVHFFLQFLPIHIIHHYSAQTPSNRTMRLEVMITVGTLKQENVQVAWAQLWSLKC